MTDKKSYILLAAVLFALAIPKSPGNEEEPRSSSAPAFEAFKVIAVRNIFDPNRQPPPPGQDSSYASRIDRSASSVPAPAREYFDLLGILIDRHNKVAFFEGAKSEYNAVVGQGETIAGYQITGISTEQLILEKEGEQIQLPVGSRMEKNDQDEWRLTSITKTQSAVASISTDQASEKNANQPAAATISTNPPSDEEAEGPPAASQSTGGANDDILKQMIERRRRELE